MALPGPTTDLQRAENDLFDHGYCIVADALTDVQTTALRERLLDQAAADICQHLILDIFIRDHVRSFKFNTDREIIAVITSPPMGYTRVPGSFVKSHKLIDKSFAVDQQMVVAGVLFFDACGRHAHASEAELDRHRARHGFAVRRRDEVEELAQHRAQAAVSQSAAR